MKFNEYRKTLLALVIQAFKSQNREELPVVELNDRAKEIHETLLENGLADLKKACQYNVNNTVINSFLLLEEEGLLEGTNFLDFKRYHAALRETEEVRVPFTFVTGGGTIQLLGSNRETYTTKFKIDGDTIAQISSSAGVNLNDLSKVKELIGKIYLTRDIQADLDKIVDTLEATGVQVKDHFQAILDAEAE